MPAMTQGRFTIHVQEGDELTLGLIVEGELVAADPAAPEVALRALRPFYIHLGDGPPWVSLDPEGRERQRGSLSIALGQSEAAGVSATVTVRTSSSD